MWAWLGVAVLARVLMASHEVDQYQSTSSLTDQLSEDGTEGELPGEELPKQGTGKSGSTKGRLQLQWKDKKIFQDMSPYGNSISSLIGELSSPAGEIPPNNPKEIDDERNKRSSTKQGEPGPPGSWTSWVTLENKAMPFRNLQDPWQEIKKSRAFSPWGGKRVTSYGQGPKVRRPIRVPFNSWGGKRSISSEEKRGRFSSWGGKRSWYFGAEENSENEVEKRTKFNAWGGKRSKNGERDDEEIKRNRFNAWGGKRSEKTEKRTPEEVGAKKSIFNAWGGKRFSTPADGAKVADEKGLKYGIWNGKEGNILNDQKSGDRIEVEDSINNLLDENDQDDDDNDNKEDEKENEIPLESEIIEFPDKKGGENYLHKSSFNPWGGKKRGENDLDEIGRGLNLILPESHHHHTRFWSWGG